MSFYFEKATTETYNFVSFIWNSNLIGAVIAGIILAKTQFLDEVKINSISQLINGILTVLQILLKCFSGITTSVSVLPILVAS